MARLKSTIAFSADFQSQFEQNVLKEHREIYKHPVKPAALWHHIIKALT